MGVGKVADRDALAGMPGAVGHFPAGPDFEHLDLLVCAPGGGRRAESCGSATDDQYRSGHHFVRV